MNQQEPVRWRYRLFAALAFFWSLFLVQAIFPPVEDAEFSWVGAAFWLVVEAGLIAFAWRAWKNRFSVMR